MKFILKAAALAAIAAVVVLYIQHQLVTGEEIDDPTYDIWR